MIVAKGTATFVLGGSETQSFTWTDLAGNPLTFANLPTPWTPSVTLTTPAQGPAVCNLLSYSTTGGTFQMANCPDCVVVVIGLGT